MKSGSDSFDRFSSKDSHVINDTLHTEVDGALLLCYVTVIVT